MFTVIDMQSATPSTAVALDSFGSFTTRQVQEANRAIITALSGTPMITLDGTTPSATVGHPLEAGKLNVIDGATLIQALKIYHTALVHITLLM